MKLKQLTSLMAGHPFRESIRNTSDGDMAVVQMRDVNQDEKIDLKSLVQVKLRGHKKPNFLKKRDILFVGRGYRIFALMVDEDLERTVAGSHFFIIRVKREQTAIRSDYLAWYINHNRAQRYFARHVAGTALPHINRTTLGDLPVILPPLEVQDLIVKSHRCRLKEKALLEALIEKKKQLLDGLLDQTLEHYQEDRT